jgi:hypothetical protein
MVDLHSTERGLSTISGAPSQCDSFGLGQFLSDANNTLTTERTGLPNFQGYNDAHVGYAQDNTDGVGLLLDGPGNARFAADRLVAVTVLQLIGYHDNRYQNQQPDAEPCEQVFEPLLTTEQSNDLTDHTRQGKPRLEPQKEDHQQVVPEPTGAAMMLLGAIVLARRTRWNREPNRTSNQTSS